MMEITIEICSFSQIEKHCKKLLVDHWQEVGKDKEEIPLNPDWEGYYALEKEERLSVMVAKDGEKIIGYSIYFLNRHLHYADGLHARNDVLYVDPEYRKNSSAGIHLLQQHKRVLKSLGVRRIYFHAKKDTALYAILQRIATEHETVFTAVL